MHDGRLDSIRTSRVAEPIPFEIYMSIMDCIPPHIYSAMERRYSPSLDWFHLDATEHTLNTIFFENDWKRGKITFVFIISDVFIIFVSVLSVSVTVSI